MSEKLRVFVSSVQKELEDERLIVQNLLNTDAFLAAHCEPILYEFEPASPEKALDGCLKSLDSCQVYLLVVAAQYGTLVGEISITHSEYRRAKEKKLPVLAFIKGDRKVKREEGTESLLKELDDDGPKYKRFGNVIELQKEVRAALVRLLKDQFGITPSSDENDIAQQTIEATSPFESQPLSRLRWADLDHDVARRLVAAAEIMATEDLTTAAVLAGATVPGSISLLAPGLCCSLKIPPLYSLSAESWLMPTAARRLMVILATTKTFAAPCLRRLIAPSPSLTGTPVIPCASSGSIAFVSMSIP